MNDFITAVRHFVQEQGVDKIASRTFIGVLSDWQLFVDEQQPFKTILSHWLDNGKLLKISKMSASDSQWKIDISDIIHLTESEGFKKELVSDLLHNLLEGIDVVNSSFDWDKEFIQKGEIILSQPLVQPISNTKYSRDEASPLIEPNIQTMQNKLEPQRKANPIRTKTVLVSVFFLLALCALVFTAFLIHHNISQKKENQIRMEELYTQAEKFYNDSAYSKAIPILTESAQNGNAKAQNLLGACFFEGKGVEQSYEKAVDWYSKAAKQDLADAQNKLGECYYQGQGVEKSYENAVEWFRKAANQGSAEAQNNLGACYYQGQGVEKSYEDAVEWFRKAADQGYAKAQHWIGVCYFNGNGVEQSYNKAVEWIQKAADKGEASAIWDLGNLYLCGNGMPKSYEKAIEYYSKAADQNFADAQYCLGYCYEHGLGVKKSYNKAYELYSQACEQRNARGQNAMGHCYYEGIIVEQSYEKAVEWFSLAADQGFAEAQYNLAGCYESGQGVEQSHETAVEWLRKADEQGFELAGKTLQEMGEQNVGRKIKQSYKNAKKKLDKILE